METNKSATGAQIKIKDRIGNRKNIGALDP
jgi:hypothetical protein